MQEIKHSVLTLVTKLNNLTLFAKGGHIVPAADSFVCYGSIGILKKWIFREFLKFIKVFGLIFLFSKILFLGNSGPSVHTFSEFWKMVFLEIYQSKYSSVVITELQTYIISI